MQKASSDTAELLAEWRQGSEEALSALIPRVEGELRRLARHYLRDERAGHSLPTGALVNEAFLRLIGQKDIQNRAHFMGVAATAMRTILIDHARRKHAAKRGGGAPVGFLEEAAALNDQSPVDLLAIDEVLTRFAESYPDKARVVELRFFGGLNVEETARVLDSSTATVKRDWRMAKAWLKRELSETEGDDEQSD